MHSPYKKAILARSRRVVVKLGSSVVATPSGVHTERVERLVRELAALRGAGHEIVLVTSGARAAGLASLGLDRIPARIPEQQAAAAIGQIGLMALYQRCFSEFGAHVGQVLLTRADVRDRTRYLNARHTMDHLLKHGVVPIVNENDSVAIEELKFGDNDNLSALVAGLVGADLLVILSDVEGLYDRDPRGGGAELVPVVEDIDGFRRQLQAAGSLSSVPGRVGTGGIATKVAAASSACHRGIPTIIASGLVAGTLGRIFDVEDSAGTLFLPRETPISNRKHWIAYGVPRKGTLVLDDGAVRAVVQAGRSLLPAGILDVQGQFAAGDCVALVDGSGHELARGLVAYDAADCRRIRGLASARVREELGYHIADEVIHRDDLVVLEDVPARRSEER
jgi:glutamate 5-kinase